jgi:hypothetical protein
MFVVWPLRLPQDKMDLGKSRQGNQNEAYDN